MTSIDGVDSTSGRAPGRLGGEKQSSGVFVQTEMQQNVTAALPESERPVDRVPLVVVLVLLFVISWVGTIPQVYGSWKGAVAVPGWMKLLQLFMLAPAFVALGVAFVNGGWPAARTLLFRLFRWRANAAVYTAVLLGPPLVILGAIVVSNALGLSAVKLPGLAAALSTFLPTFLAYLLLNTEELAWRGYVLPRFLRRWNPLAATLILGVVWAVFHSPYFFMKGGHPGGFHPIVFLIMVVALAVVFTRLFAVTGGSVLLPHLLHQSVNGWAEALPVLPRFSGSSIPAVVAVSVLAVIVVAMVVLNRVFWLRSPAVPSEAPDSLSAELSGDRRLTT